MSERATGLQGRQDLALIPSVSLESQRRQRPSDADSGDCGDKDSVWISSGSCPASARELARQSQADLPDLLPGRAKPASEASSPPCHRKPADGAAGSGSSQRLLEHGFCRRQPLQRPSLPGLNDKSIILVESAWLSKPGRA